MRWLAAALACAALACAALAACGGEEAPSPPQRSAFVGIVSEDSFEGGAAYRGRALTRQADAGIGLVRQPFYWGLVETSPGRFDFSGLDAYVAAASRAQMRILPVLFGTPDFRSSAPPPGRRARGTYPPARPLDFAEYASRLVRRYGRGGSFWKRHDGPPITAWQIWNEPNLPVFWASGPDPAAYTRLLRAAAVAIKAADPRAEVVSAGLSQSRHGARFESFLRGMYRAGAGEALDSVGVHPYARDAAGTLQGVRRANGVLRAAGRPARIRVTEFGWASAGPRSRFTVNEAGQAVRVRETIRLLAEHRRELGIEGIVYYDWRDKRPSAEQGNFFGLHTGLLRADGSAKPALAALGEAARSIRP